MLQAQYKAAVAAGEVDLKTKMRYERAIHDSIEEERSYKYQLKRVLSSPFQVKVKLKVKLEVKVKVKVTVKGLKCEG